MAASVRHLAKPTLFKCEQTQMGLRNTVHAWDSMDDTSHTLKPWVIFAGCVLVIVILYWAQAVLVPIALAVRHEALLPNLRYAPMVAVAGAVMAVAAWLVPGPTIVAAIVASVAYAAILLVAPGTLNEVARTLVPELGRGR